MSWGGGYATAGAIIAQTAEFILKWAGDIILAGILLDTGRDIAEKAKEDFQFATDRIIELNQCREQLACAVQNHNLSVTIPFQRHAMQTALSLGVPRADYGGLCSFYQNLSIRSLGGATAASREYQSLFCVKPSAYRREFDYYGGSAAVDATYARARNQERREELMREMKVASVQTAHAGTFSSPLPTFGLLDAAASIYGYIQSQAVGSLGGAISAFSYGATSLTGTIGNAFGGSDGSGLTGGSA